MPPRIPRSSLHANPRQTLRTPRTQPTHSTPFSTSTPSRARLIPRPHRPYTFTQLIALSDGSTFLHRTTSPAPVYRCSNDSRNTPLWNPSDSRLRNLETDETGRLRAFRRRFGRGWDTKSDVAAETLSAGDVGTAENLRSDMTKAEGVKGRTVEPAVAPGSASDVGAPKEKGAVDADQIEGDKVKSESATASQTKRVTTERAVDQDADDDNLMDLISSFEAPKVGPRGGVVSAKTRPTKGKK